MWPFKKEESLVKPSTAVGIGAAVVSGAAALWYYLTRKGEAHAAKSHAGKGGSGRNNRHK